VGLSPFRASVCVTCHLPGSEVGIWQVPLAWGGRLAIWSQESASWTTVRTGRLIHPYHEHLTPPFRTGFRDVGELRPHTDPNSPRSHELEAGAAEVVAETRHRPGELEPSKTHKSRKAHQILTLGHDARAGVTS
jgi:hypothetical protein